MSLTTPQMKDQFRLDVDDAEEPGDGDDSESLWKDSEIYAYMDRAQKEFARLTEIFLDSSTAAVTELAIAEDDPWVDLDSRIIDIVRAKLESNNRRVSLKKLEEMDDGYMLSDYGTQSSSDWESVTGEPYILITNMEADRGRLFPIPVEIDNLILTVVRYPLKTINSRNVPLEVTNTRHQHVLLDGIKAFAYEKQDADVFNLDISERYYGKFLKQCDEIKTEFRRKRRPGRAIKYGGL